MSFKWTSKYSIGNPDIDKEHKHLFVLAEKLLLMNNQSVSRENLKSIILELRNYVETHFQHEEKFMGKIDYPHLEKHQKIHEEIVNEINQILLGAHSLKELSANLQGLMQKWISDHIIQEDLQIRDFLEQKDIESRKNN
ncbi:MAG: hemerythrin family protein [Calditrichia bacterium]